MNNLEQVAANIEERKKSGMPLQDAVWETAKDCVGWSYVYGAWGDPCTPSERQKRLRYHPEKTEIKNKCQNFNGDKTCHGCKWYPNDQRTRCYDCRGFTDWCLKQFGIDLYGDSVGVQWNHDSNWDAKGEIKDIPDDILVCLFRKKDGNWQHTGLGYKGQTCECSSGVQFKTTRASNWTHWAIPKGIGGDIPVTHKTIRKGDSGPDVVECQEDLIKLGYDLGPWGADGKFGNATDKAVREFQAAHPPLVTDGIVGKATWAALDEAVGNIPEPDSSLYTVHIQHLTYYQAEALIKQYPGSYMTQEV